MKGLSVAFGAKRHVRARCRLVPFADDPEAGILLRRRGEPPPLDLMNNLTMLHVSTCSARGKHVHFDTPNGASKGQAPDSARTDGCCFRRATCRDGKQSRRFGSANASKPDAIEQLPGIGMNGRIEERAGLVDFNQPASLHDRDFVAVMGGNAKIGGYDQ